MTIESLVLLALTLAASGIFAYKMGKIGKLIMAGPKDETYGPLGPRLLEVWNLVVLQKKLFKEPIAGIVHAFIFYGFVLLTVGTIEMFLSVWFTGFSLDFLGPLYGILLFLQDIFAFLILFGILHALKVRFIDKKKRLQGSKEAMVDAAAVLVIIMFLMVTLLVMNGARLNHDEAFAAYTMPFAAITGKLLVAMGLSTETLAMVDRVSLWGHLLGILGFLVFLPFSKHLHLILALPNVFFKKAIPAGELSYINLEDENAESFGKSKIQEFTRKQLLDSFTCVECGRCTSVCPANNTGKPLSPKKIINDIKHQAQFVAENPNYDKNLIGDHITTDELWACTTCMACQEACPLGIVHIDKIVDMRRHLTLMESDFPAELGGFFKNLENNSNPWGFGSSARGDWAKKMGVRILAESEDKNFEYLYFAGCAASFSERGQKIATAMANLLNKAGVSFAILGSEEGCTGDAARRIGNEYLAQTLITANVETLNRYGVKKIVTTCPHCYNTLKNEYGRFGGHFEVSHSVEFVNKLMQDGKLKVEKSYAESLTYHDSCYMGRYNDVVEEPRQIIAALGAKDYKEIGKSKKNSFCCGAGGGRMFMEEHIGKRVNHERMEQIAETGQKVVASSCPFCLTMFEDGKREKNMNVETVDLVEIVDRATGNIPSVQ